jgi:N-acylglucosamine-6-phosphate 2-epimerase
MLDPENRLFVSCQAKQDSYLNKPEILIGVAQDVISAGAIGIRAEGIENLKLMHANLRVPIISLIKSEFDDRYVCITRKISKFEELLQVGSEIIAIDGTDRIFDGLSGPRLISIVKE